MSAWQALPEPFSRVQIAIDPRIDSIGYYARGAPEDLVASEIAKPEWIPPWPGSKQKLLPDGGHALWARRNKNARTWRLHCFFKSVDAVRRMPGVPADIAFEKLAPEPTYAESHPDRQQSASEWRAWMMREALEFPVVVSTIIMSWRCRGAMTSFGERFSVDPQDAAQLAAVYGRFEREFVKLFSTVRVVDHQAAARGLRLIVNNTR